MVARPIFGLRFTNTMVGTGQAASGPIYTNETCMAYKSSLSFSTCYLGIFGLEGAINCILA